MSNAAKELIFEEAAREALSKGIKKLYDTVALTLGPKGRFVGLDASFGAPKTTSDGYSVAKEVELKDQYQNMGVSIGKEIASKMKEKCGDGTTTSLILLKALVEGGVKNIAAGSSPISLKRGMEKAAAAVLAELEKNASSISSQKDIEEIAIAAASNNEEVGEFIAKAFQKVGKSGVISIEEGKATETQMEIVEGMEFDRGYLSSYFCTNMENMQVEMHSPRILITDQKITSVQQILPLLQAAAGSGQEMLIIAEDIEGDALSTLVINKLRGTLKVCAVKAPGFGERRKELLLDLAALTGATLVSEDLGMSLKNTDSTSIGGAEKILISKEKTTVVGGEGSKERIQERLSQIEAELKLATSPYDKEKLNERKAKLSGGVAVIRVGAATEPVMKQKKQVFEDSLNSTRAALEEGVVIGGGVALLRAATSSLGKEHRLSDEEQVGADLVLASCASPFKQLVENSGLESALLLQEVLQKEGSFGFNVNSGKIENLFKCGIKDPLKVVKHALALAVSAAGTLLLTECLIGNAPEETN